MRHRAPMAGNVTAQRGEKFLHLSAVVQNHLATHFRALRQIAFVALRILSITDLRNAAACVSSFVRRAISRGRDIICLAYWLLAGPALLRPCECPSKNIAGRVASCCREQIAATRSATHGFRPRRTP